MKLFSEITCISYAPDCLCSLSLYTLYGSKIGNKAFTYLLFKQDCDSRIPARQQMSKGPAKCAFLIVYRSVYV